MSEYEIFALIIMAAQLILAVYKQWRDQHKDW